LLLSGCKKEDSPDPQFNSFEEEMEYLVEKYIDLETMTGVVILCNQSFENAIIRFGEDMLKAVNK